MKKETNSKEFIFETIEKFILAIYGGFVGAVFGLVATGSHSGKQVWFLTMFYGVFVFLVIFIVNHFKKKRK